MVQRFWWGAASGAYAGHGEVYDDETSQHCGTSAEHGGNSWSGGGGYLCGQSPKRIAWFRDYMANTTLHPPFSECDGDDDGYVHTLTCGTEYIMFHFYNGIAYANNSFQYISLPTGQKMRQDLLQPWEMKISLIWEPPIKSPTHTYAPGTTGVIHTHRTTNAMQEHVPPPDARVWGPHRGAGWSTVGIMVDEDTVPHILTFTAPKSGAGKNSGKEDTRPEKKEAQPTHTGSWLDLPPGL